MTIDYLEATNKIHLDPTQKDLHSGPILGFCLALKHLGFIRNFWYTHKYRRMPNGGHGDMQYAGVSILVDARRQPDGN